MSRKDIELIRAETRRLEVMGVVLGMSTLSVFLPEQQKAGGSKRTGEEGHG